MAGTVVVGGPASAGLARRLARRLGAPYVGASARVFPDGEARLSARIPRCGSAVVVQSAHPPVDANLVRALVLVAEARRRARSVAAVVPYMGYARQDREFLPGEAVTARAVAGLLEAAGASRVVAVDVHSEAALAMFRVPARSVEAAPALARRVRGMRLRRPLVVSPDAGGARRAAAFASLLGAEHAALSKRRDRRTGAVRVSAGGLGGGGGRDAVLYDDMISTGGSAAQAASLLRRAGFRRVVAVCAHALLVGGAAERLRAAGVSEVVGTNTVPRGPRDVDVSGAIAEALPAAARRHTHKARRGGRAA